MNVLIDAGACEGRFVKKFVRTPMYSLGWDIHVFEPNTAIPIVCDGVTVHREAVWTTDGKIKFYVSDNWVGSTVVRDKVTGKLDKNTPIKVPCINLGAWIMKTFKPDDYIVLRMDIEGAEYQVLPAMIADGSIKYVNELYYEPHWEKVGVSRETNRLLAKQLAKLTEVYFIL